MSLIRCNRFLCRKNSNLVNLFKHSTVFYSDEKSSSDDNKEETPKADEKKRKTEKTSAKREVTASQSLSPESQNRLNELLKKLSSRSTLSIVKEVRTAKPLGYKRIANVQNLDGERAKPRNVRDAARAVSQEMGDTNVENDILSPYKPADKHGKDFLE